MLSRIDDSFGISVLLSVRFLVVDKGYKRALKREYEIRYAIFDTSSLKTDTMLQKIIITKSIQTDDSHVTYIIYVTRKI